VDRGDHPEQQHRGERAPSDSTANGAIKVGTCGHDPGFNGPTRATLYETVPGGNDKTGVSKSSEGDCDGASPFNGKVSKGGVNGRAYHAMLSYDDSDVSGATRKAARSPPGEAEGGR
jgi:hypothetical protein